MGPKGEPKSIDHARTTVNPHYYEHRKWRVNCQRCVWAYELQRRGYDVEALPALERGDLAPYMYSRRGWGKVAEELEPINMPSRNTAQKMADTMASFGDGARAIIRLTWKGGRNGHVINAEQINGVTHYIDAQTGKEINIQTYLNDAIKKDTQVIRVDNKKINTSLISDFVKRRG